MHTLTVPATQARAAGSSAWLGMVPDDWFESLQVVPFWAIAELVRCKNCLDAWLDAGETLLALCACGL